MTVIPYHEACLNAFIYTHKHGMSVLPIGEQKKPMVAWKEFQTRRPTLDEIIAWDNRGFNLAIITGRVSGGLVVVDCESQEDAEWFWKERGKSSVIVKTRRGFHFYFHSSEQVRNAQRVDGRYDVRGEGGYVLAPPSVHADGVYEWKEPLVGLVEDLPTFNPEWRPEKLYGPYESETKIANGPAYIATIEATAGSGGHSATYSAAACLKDAGLDMAEALICLQEWNRTNAHPPWSDRELLHKIRDVYGRA